MLGDRIVAQARQLALKVSHRIKHGREKYFCDVTSWPFKCTVRRAGTDMTWTDFACHGLEIGPIKGGQIKCHTAYQYAVHHNIRQYATSILNKAKSEYGCDLTVGTTFTFTKHAKSGIIDAAVKMPPRDEYHELRGATGTMADGGGTNPGFMLIGIAGFGVFIWLKSIGRA